MESRGDMQSKTEASDNEKRERSVVNRYLTAVKVNWIAEKKNSTSIMTALLLLGEKVVAKHSFMALFFLVPGLSPSGSIRRGELPM